MERGYWFDNDCDWWKDDIRMKFYLASIYARRDELKGYTKQLEDLGHEVTSRWIKEDFDDSNWEVQADVDLDDIDAAKIFIVFTEPAGYLGRGGKDFETGYALGQNKAIYMIGPAQHQFYESLTRYVYEDWDEFVKLGWLPKE